MAALRKPIPPRTEQTFKDKSMYNRPDQKQELKKIIQDVSKELKKSSRTDQIFEQSGIKIHKAPATTKEEEDILEKCRYENVVKAAMEKTDYFTGGFDILKKWQKQKGTKKPVSKPNGKGFDIVKQIVKNPTPVNK